jgi:hypothetical protein
MMRIAVITMLLSFLASPTLGVVGLITVFCDDPQGFILSHGPNDLDAGFDRNVTKHVERFGSKPTFVFDSSKPQELLVLWGSYIDPDLPAGLAEALDLEAKAERATIVFNTERQISAIQPYEGGVYLYTLYPKLGYGVFVWVSHWLTSGKAKADMYYGNCRFQR